MNSSTNKKGLKITLITQDFHPMRGGIAAHLKQIYLKYFHETEFNVIVPDYIGKKEDYSSFPFKVYQAGFSPFTLDTQREKGNKQILDILDTLHPDILLFGYLRSHPEVGLIYKSKNPDSKFGIFTYAKEAFIDDCICKENNILGAHTGYLAEEAEFYKSVLNKADFVFAISKFTRNLLVRQGIRENVHIIPPCISVNQQYLDPVNNGASINLLSVGRLIKRKGQSKCFLSFIGERFKKLRYKNLNAARVFQDTKIKNRSINL